MNITIFCATRWEAGHILGIGAWTRSGPGAYRRDTPRGSAELVLTGIGRKNAGRAAEAAMAGPPGRPDLAISAGFAAALAEEALPGDLVLDAGRSDPSLLETFAGISRRLGIPAHRGSVLSADRVLLRAEEKKSARSETGAIAAEMEGGAISEVCRNRGVPFCAVRTVSDSRDQDIPAAVRSLGPGGVPGGRFWLDLCARPGDWMGLWRLAASSRKAGKNLSKILEEYLCAE